MFALGSRAELFEQSDSTFDCRSGFVVWYLRSKFEWINSPPEIDPQHLLINEVDKVTKAVLKQWRSPFANGSVDFNCAMQYRIVNDWGNPLVDVRAHGVLNTCNLEYIEKKAILNTRKLDSFRFYCNKIVISRPNWA